jgi:hypothetical protein
LTLRLGPCYNTAGSMAEVLMRDKRGWIVAGLMAVCLSAAGCGGGGGDTPGGGGSGGAGGADAGKDAGAEPKSKPGMGTIKGKVFRQGEVDHSGITVTLNGTDKVAMTVEDGGYRMLNVTPGTYTVTASLAGYGVGASNPFEVKADKTTTVETITLQKGTGALAGKVLLSGEQSHQGTAIVVQGTSHTAVTEDNG